MVISGQPTIDGFGTNPSLRHFVKVPNVSVWQAADLLVAAVRTIQDEHGHCGRLRMRLRARSGFIPSGVGRLYAPGVSSWPDVGNTPCIRQISEACRSYDTAPKGLSEEYFWTHRLAPLKNSNCRILFAGAVRSYCLSARMAVP